MIEITGLNERNADNLKVIFGDKIKIDADNIVYRCYTALISSTIEVKIKRTYNDIWDCMAHDLIFEKEGHALYTLRSEDYIGFHVH